jgi:dynein heavy chain
MGHGEFTPLKQWIREHKLFHKLLNIRFFSRYRSWKCFMHWKKTVLHEKIVKSKQSLQETLFFLDPTLRGCLLQMQDFNFKLNQSKSLIYVDDIKSYEVSEFVQEQKRWIDNFSAITLTEWIESCSNKVTEAARKSLTLKGFEFVLLSEVKNSDAPFKKLSFTEQAARRTECRRLQRFVKLCDFIICSTLHNLVVNSAQDFLRLAFRGCNDSDVVVDDAGSGVIILDAIGAVLNSVSASANESAEDIDNLAKVFSAGIQVGGIVVGSEISTNRLIECGAEGFVDIISRIIGSNMTKLILVDEFEDDVMLIDDDEVKASHSKENLIKSKAKDDSKWKSGAEKNASKKMPLFRTELLIGEDKNFYYSPSVHDYLSIIDSLLKIYLNTVEKVSCLTNSIPFLDPSNLAGGAYSAVRGLEDPEYSEASQLGSVIIEGPYFKEVCGRLRGVLVGMFINATAWMRNLDKIRQMWIANEKYNVLEELLHNCGEVNHLLATTIRGEDSVANTLLNYYSQKAPCSSISTSNVLQLAVTIETDSEGQNVSPLVRFFDESLKNFAYQAKTMSEVPSKWSINNLLIDTTYLKSVLEPSPLRCFGDVSKILPGLARDKNELLLTEVQSWVKILNTPSSNVESFVEYLGWLETICENMPMVDLLEDEVVKLYRILELHKIYIQPTDLAMFQTLSPTLRNLKDSVDIATDSKEESISKFTGDLEKNLHELVNEVSEIRNKAQDPMVLYPSSSSDTVLVFLQDLQVQLERAELLKKRYESWAELFHNGGSKSKADDTSGTKTREYPIKDDGELEETKTEINLKCMLWNSLKEWQEVTTYLFII